MNAMNILQSFFKQFKATFVKINPNLYVFFSHHPVPGRKDAPPLLLVSLNLRRNQWRSWFVSEISSRVEMFCK